MITFRCTQKMFDELRIFRKSVGEPEDGFLGSWFAHIFKIGRKKCVLFMNDQTLYTVLLYGMKKKDFENLNRRFVSGLTANLLQDGFPSEVVASVGMACHPMAWGKTNNRSVLGSMNDLIFVCKVMAERRDLELEVELLELNQGLNKTPMSSLKEVYAVDKMSAVLAGWEPA